MRYDCHYFLNHLRSRLLGTTCQVYKNSIHGLVIKLEESISQLKLMLLLQHNLETQTLQLFQCSTEADNNILSTQIKYRKANFELIFT